MERAVSVATQFALRSLTIILFATTVARSSWAFAVRANQLLSAASPAAANVTHSD
jgi:hypothetical protein